MKKRKEVKMIILDNSTLKQWWGNVIGAEGTEKVSESLLINTTLTSLNLGCDERYNNHIKGGRWRE